jgi:DNA-binding MarR family transcriptional regulator
MSGPLPLPTLLSPALVAFTIEFDNAAESRMPHRTNGDKGAGARGPWLVSQVMWANVLAYVPDGGITVSELHARARTARDSLGGLRRWGYLKVEAGAADPVLRLTSSGRRARRVWAPLATEIEGRWVARFGPAAIGALRAALGAIVGQLDLALPRYLPVIYPTKESGRMEPAAPGGPSLDDEVAALDLSVLLSRALHAFTLDFEDASRLSLALCANTLRVLDDVGVRVRDLPRLTGVSKEANQMCIGFLERGGHLVSAPDPAATRGQVLRLTPDGLTAQARVKRLVTETEARWTERFGPDAVTGLRRTLEAVVGPSPRAVDSPLFGGLEPPEGGWRASVARPETLPHHPMVLHRGGYPDGS